ncbi:MAG: helix-turn-helix domain-containing protein [Chloroflexi bacterium]|nr:helix-turn-helix domain-containing protein [Chloroflexota bacterium]
MTDRYEPITMSLREVAERLSIGKTSAYRLVASGDLPGFRVGSADTGTWRVLRRDFEAYIDARLEAARTAHEQARRAS